MQTFGAVQPALKNGTIGKMGENRNGTRKLGPSGNSGRPRSNPHLATCNFRKVLAAVVGLAPRLRPQVREGLRLVAAEFDVKNATVNDYLGGRAPYPSSLPETIIRLTKLDAEGMVVKDFECSQKFLATLAPDSSGPAGSDPMTKLMGRWRKRAQSVHIGIEERKGLKILRTVDPGSAPVYLPGTYWLTLRRDPALPPFRLLLLEHDVTRAEWLCMSKYRICDLDIRAAKLHGKVAFEIGHAPGRCTIHAIVSQDGFGHAIENMVENRVAESAVLTGPQVHMLAAELDKADRVEPLATCSFTYEVAASR